METTQTQTQTQEQEQRNALTEKTQKSTAQELDILLKGAAGKKFELALGKGTNTFITSLLEMVGSDQYLQKCSATDLYKEALKAAGVGLPISKALGRAYIVAYWNSKEKKYCPTLIPGYKGLIQLYKNGGFCKTINDGVYYEGELVETDALRGRFNIDRSRRTSNRVAGYFAYIEETTGFEKAIFITLDEMAEFAKNYGQAGKLQVSVEQLKELAQNTSSTGLGWTGDFTSMARKTCIRRLLGRYGSMNIEAKEIIEQSNRVEDGGVVFQQSQEQQVIDIEAEAADEDARLEAVAQSVAGFARAAEAQPQAQQQAECPFK